MTTTTITLRLDGSENGPRGKANGGIACGPERRDGLDVPPGLLAGDVDMLAAPFAPTDRYAVGGEVRPAAVWGALDCPSYHAAAMRRRRICFLGSLEAHQARPVTVGERLVVWAGPSPAAIARCARPLP